MYDYAYSSPTRANHTNVCALYGPPFPAHVLGVPKLLVLQVQIRIVEHHVIQALNAWPKI